MYKICIHLILVSMIFADIYICIVIIIIYPYYNNYIYIFNIIGASSLAYYLLGLFLLHIILDSKYSKYANLIIIIRIITFLDNPAIQQVQASS